MRRRTVQRLIDPIPPPKLAKMVADEKSVIDLLVRLEREAPKTIREHERCCDICEKGTAHFVGDDETQLVHIVDEWGNESWCHPRDYALMRKAGLWE